MQQSFRCKALGELVRQLHFAPAAKRIEQVQSAEKLHDEIDPAVTYPYDYVAYRITGYRSEAEAKAQTLLVGEAISYDLRLLIDGLSSSVTMPVDKATSFETLEQLAERLSVSTKTIGRWRRMGLRWRWMTINGGSKRIVIGRRAVKVFTACHGERVRKASRFSKLPSTQRKRLIERARRIVSKRASATLNQVAAHLSRKMDRALETIRQLFEQYDRRHPESPIFANETGPFTTQQQRIMARARRMGIAVRKIAERFDCSPSTVYRAIHQRRAADLRRLRIDFVPSPTFARTDADEVILGAAPPFQKDSTIAPAVDDLPDPLQALYDCPTPGPQPQRLLFRKFNYLKFKAATARDRLNRYQARARDLDRIEIALQQTRKVRGTLVIANLPTILSVARRHLVGKPDPSQVHLLKLLAEGHHILFDAIESYDLARSDSFTTYLTYRLMRHFVSYLADRPQKGRAYGRNAVEATIGRMRVTALEADVDLFEERKAKSEEQSEEGEG